MKNKSIQVTQPSIAPLDEYQELLKDLWNTKMLTNNGPFVKKLEKKLCQYLDISNFIAVTNGTIALQIAIKALGLKGEIITTPFTWIATISSIKWENCTPIFCDIDYETLNIDSNKIEQHITDKTVAIMPVHVFGNPCDVNQIEKIAKKNNLKVIYDAAHAIGSTINNKSVLNYGDISATSMHATKIFNTGEGGGCITTNTKLNRRIKQIRFFGHDLDLLKNQETQIIDDGLNGKMSELHAALGLVNLKYQSQIMDDRKRKNNK